MIRKFSIGDKVKPINKTPRHREMDNCSTFYRQQELQQDFLYVTGFDEEESARLGIPCYWCNVTFHLGGDSFAESDLIAYTEGGKDIPTEVIAYDAHKKVLGFFEYEPEKREIADLIQALEDAGKWSNERSVVYNNIK